MKNNPVFYTLASSLPYARLLTLLVELSGAAGSPKHVYNLRKPEKVRFTKFWRVYCFGLSTRVTGPFPIFQLIPTYEVLAYFMIQHSSSRLTRSNRCMADTATGSRIGRCARNWPNTHQNIPHAICAPLPSPLATPIYKNIPRPTTCTTNHDKGDAVNRHHQFTVWGKSTALHCILVSSELQQLFGWHYVHHPNLCTCIGDVY